MIFQPFLLRGAIPFITRLERRIASQPVARFAFFFICTAITIGVLGYHFGTFDHSGHIPFLRQIADPTLYPGDSFLPLRLTKYSYFWHLFVPALRFGVLEYTLFAVYVVSIYLTFVGIWRLAMVLFSSSRVAMLATIIFILPHFGFGFVPIFEFSLVNRVVVFPFLLFAIELYISKRYIPAFFLVGVLFNFHALSGLFVLIMFGTDVLLRRREIELGKIGLSAAFFILMASSVLLWKAQTPGASLMANYPWFHDINRGFITHVYSLFSVWPPFLLSTVGGVVLLVMAYRYARSFGSKYPHTIIGNFLIGITAAVVIHTLAVTVYPSEFLIQFQLLRIGEFALLFFYLYATEYIYRVITSGQKRIEEGLVLFGLLFVSITPLLYAFGELLYRRKQLSRWGNTLVIGSITNFVLTLIVFFQLGLYMPGVYIFTRQTPVVDVQLWVRNNTPNNVMVLAPPYLWGMYDVDWRVLSERSTVVTWSELLELAFAPQRYSEWVRRFDEVAPGARAHFGGYLLDNQSQVRAAYLSLSPQNVERLVKKYQASYFVTEKNKEYPFLVRYENEIFRVYDMQSL